MKLTYPQMQLLRKIAIKDYRGRKGGEWKTSRKLIELGLAVSQFPYLVITPEGLEEIRKASK
jgi:hypothetical protein